MEGAGQTQNVEGGKLRVESCEQECGAVLPEQLRSQSRNATGTPLERSTALHQPDQASGLSELHKPTASTSSASIPLFQPLTATPPPLSLNPSATPLSPILFGHRSRSSSLSSLTSLDTSDSDSDSDANLSSHCSPHQATPSSDSNSDNSDSDWESERSSRSFTRASTPCSEEYGTPSAWRPFSAEPRRIKSPSVALSNGEVGFALVIPQSRRRPFERRKLPRIRSASPSSEEDEEAVFLEEVKPLARRPRKIPRVRSPSPSSDDEMSSEDEEKPLARLGRKIPRIRSLSVSSQADEISSENEEEVPLAAFIARPPAPALESSDEEETPLALLRRSSTSAPPPDTPSTPSSPYPMPTIGSVWSTRRALLLATHRASNEQGYKWRLVSRHCSLMDVVGCDNSGSDQCTAMMEIVPLQLDFPEGRWVVKTAVGHNHPPAGEALTDWKVTGYLSREFNKRVNEHEQVLGMVKREGEAERQIRIAPSIVTVARRRETPGLWSSNLEEERTRQLSIPSTPPPSKISPEPISLSVLRHLFQQLRPSLLPLVDTLHDKGMRDKNTVWDFIESPLKVLDKMKYGNDAVRKTVVEETGKVRKEFGWRGLVVDGM